MLNIHLKSMHLAALKRVKSEIELMVKWDGYLILISRQGQSDHKFKKKKS